MDVMGELLQERSAAELAHELGQGGEDAGTSESYRTNTDCWSHSWLRPNFYSPLPKAPHA